MKSLFKFIAGTAILAVAAFACAQNPPPTTGEPNPPVVTAVLNPTSPNGPDNEYVGPVQVTLSATDTEYTVTGIYYSFDDATFTPYSGPFTVSTPGYYEIFAYGTDSNRDGQYSPVVASFTIAQSAPVFNAPANVTVDATCPAGALVNYPAVTANDPIYGTITAVCTPPSGSTFPIGTTTVTCVATDPGGNSAQTTFEVEVLAPLQISESVQESLQGIGTLPNRTDERELQGAISALEDANDLSLWEDPSQPDPFIGLLVYRDWAEAELDLALLAHPHGVVPTATLSTASARILDAAVVAAEVTLQSH